MSIPSKAKRLITAAMLALAAVLFLGPTPQAATPAAAFSIADIDLHDGQLLKTGSTYVLTGTEYGCGFQWYVTNTPWCGFGYSTATSLAGPWSAPQLLFDPNSTDPWTGQSWQVECGSTGQGCFNPRLIQRSGWGANDGVWVLWWNSPLDWSRNHANAYNAAGCDVVGTTIGCGPGETVGAHGSYTKPSLADCGGNGDYGFIQAAPGSGQAPAMICTEPSAASLSIEQLNWWGTSGGTGNHNVAGLTSVEGPGGYYDAASGKYVITYSDGNCGYCAGTATGYATSTALMGPYTAPANVAAASPPVGGRRDLSATTCGGQPRTVSVVDGQPWQGIDLWTGSRNETTAGVLYQPLQFTNPSNVAGDGKTWQPFTPWACS